MAVAYWDYRHDIAIIDGIIVKSRRIVVPQKMRECLLQKLHRVHQGIDKSIQRARDKWFWPGMTEQIRRLILTCPSCLEHQPKPKQAEVIPVIIHKPGTDHSQWKNGRYENAIGRLKRLLENSKDEETTMEDILVTIRDTPLDTNIPSPNELMFHRKVKSDLPSIPLSLFNSTNSINAEHRSVKHAERRKRKQR